MKIIDLKTEHLDSPFAIDNKNPRFSWIIEADGKYNIKQIAYRIAVASEEELLDKNDFDMWDSGIVQSSCSFEITYLGKELQSAKAYYWKVFVYLNNKTELKSETAFFGMGLLNDSDWKCGFIGLDSRYIEKSKEAADKAGMPSPYLRCTFEVNSKIKSAKLYATALGLYEISINGTKAGNYELTPGFTDYNESLQYQGYDVTDLLKEGQNAIGAILGDGWYCGNIAITGRNQYGDYPLGLMAHLRIEYQDGTCDIITTDSQWRASTGAIIYNDIQTGEFYDARKEPFGFDTTLFDDSNWHEVIAIKPALAFKLKAAKGPQVKAVMSIKAISLDKDKYGRYIFDMGQNMVGRIAFRMKEENGRRITFRFGEMLNTDGTLYTENLRTASQTDIYITKGGEELFEPKFTFHGFRYVEVSGLSCRPSIEDISGIVIYSACEPSGEVETSDSMVNKLFSNQLWGQRGNFVSIPTDCPQRDERMGWTGDAQVFARTACYNMSCVGFYEKYIEDLLEAQKENGAVTDVVPNVKRQDGNDLVGNGTAAWGDAVFVIPWTVYNMYGDKKILEDSYPGMCRYIKYLEETTNGFLRPDYGYGDWLSIDDDTPKDVLSTAFFAHSADIISKTAKVLCKLQDSYNYRGLFNNIKKAFNKTYVSSDGVIKGDTQCCYLLALKFNLLTPVKNKLAIKHLIRTIERKNWHLSTGFVGVSYLLPMLSKYGHNDIAYRLLLNETYPSWGYSIKNGATTIWERWNSYTKENGFGDVGMNSFNHYSLGSVGEWMYRYLGGINPIKPGFSKIEIKPYTDKSIGFANVSYRSCNGTIKSSWSYENSYIHYDIEIPANTTALIYLRMGEVNETAGKAVYSGVKDGYKVYKAGSGVYKFTVLI